jgi:hypothetical protein
MIQKIACSVLCLFMLPFIQGCDETDVATGVAVGAVVGGAVVAASTDDYYGDPYYRVRYNNYYRYRHARYTHRYGAHRYGPRFGGHHSTRPPIFRPGHGPGRGHGRHHLIQPAAYQPQAVAVSSQVERFADFYQMPMDSAQVIWKAQSRALNGDVQGLAALGFYAKDLERLVQMKAPSKDTVYRMSLRTGLSEDHIADVLSDFQQEYAASKKAGRF